MREFIKAHRHRVIIDIDGTLADISHRLYRLNRIRAEGLAGEEKLASPDWRAFAEAMDDDVPKFPIVALVRTLYSQGHEIIIMTGRYEKYRKRTIKWLNWHLIPFDRLFMRPTGDNTQDALLKERFLYEDFGGPGGILFAVDDRQRVVDMWRRNGVTCLQCQKGDY